MKKNTPIFLFIVFLLCLYSTSVINNDIWMHLKVGEYIAENKSLPHHDPFSFTSDNEWILHEWAVQLIFFIIYSVGGFNALIALKVVVLMLTIYLLSRIIKSNLILLILVVVAFLIRSHSFVRPHIFFYLFLALALYILEKRKYIFLPLLTLIWANFHSSVLIGLIVIAVYLGEHAISKKSPRSAMILLASMLTPLINPSGFRILTYPIINQKYFMLIKEWMPFSLTNPYMILFILFLISTTIFIYLNVRKNKTLRLSDIALLVLFSYLAFQSKRNIAVAAIMFAPIIGRYAPNIKKDISILCSLLFVALIIFSATSLRGLTFNYAEDIFPPEPINFIKENNIKGNIFNEHVLGGYLIFNLYPDSKVFIDGRVVMHGPTWPDYYQIKNAEPGWERLIIQYNITYFIIQPDAKVGRELLNNNWNLAYFDDRMIIIVPSTTKVKALKYISPYDVEIPKTRELAKKAVDEYTYLLDCNPDFASGHKNIGLLYNGFGMREKAIYHFRENLRIKPKGQSADDLKKAIKIFVEDSSKNQK